MAKEHIETIVFSADLESYAPGHRNRKRMLSYEDLNELTEKLNYMMLTRTGSSRRSLMSSGSSRDSQRSLDDSIKRSSSVAPLPEQSEELCEVDCPQRKHVSFAPMLIRTKKPDVAVIPDLPKGKPKPVIKKADVQRMRKWGKRLSIKPNMISWMGSPSSPVQEVS